ncbi:MAG: cupin domain-containing protein [Acidobacteriota bacterium]|nr:cupin domain-containing protein [Acidobacteriota bacterium]
MDTVNRREFAGLATLLVGAIAGLGTDTADAQAGTPQGGSQSATPAPAAAGPKELTSGVFKPQPGKGMQNGHESHGFLNGLLKAGNIRLEMHESVQQPGAPHEAVGTHKHSEIWLVQRGSATLWLNGVEHRLEAGDVGLCCAGDRHWIANAGTTELAYFVVTLGPPE